MTEGAADLIFTKVVDLYRTRCDQQLIQIMRRRRRLRREISLHGGERDEDFVHVPAVVAGVLLLLLHHADHGVGKVVEMNRLTDSTTIREQLLRRIGSKERHPARLVFVTLVVKASFAGIQRAYVTERRKG